MSSISTSKNVIYIVGRALVTFRFSWRLGLSVSPPRDACNALCAPFDTPCAPWLPPFAPLHYAPCAVLVSWRNERQSFDWEQMRPGWNRNRDHTQSCPTVWHLSTSWGPLSRPPWTSCTITALSYREAYGGPSIEPPLCRETLVSLTADVSLCSLDFEGRIGLLDTLWKA